MPTGIYIRSKECKKKLSDAQKRLYAHGYINPMKDQHHTAKSNRQNSKAQRALYHNGYINPNKGKKQTYGAKRKQQKTWRKKYSNGYVHPMKGKHHTKKSKHKISNANKNRLTGEKNPAKRQDVRQKLIDAWKARKINGYVSPLKNRRISKKHRDNISIAKKQLYVNGYVSPLKGKTYEEFYGEEKAKTLVASLSGENNANWLGNKIYRPYGLEFNRMLKQAIRFRDGYCCQECVVHERELRTKNNRHYKLMVHHIDYNKQNNSPENLISLCRPCHSKTNFKRKNWTKYFKEKLVYGIKKVFG